VDCVEVEVDPGQSGLIDNVGADKEVFWVFDSAFDESGYGVVFEEELVRSRTLGSASAGTLSAWVFFLPHRRRS
jgi:hypothetical protein